MNSVGDINKGRERERAREIIAERRVPLAVSVVLSLVWQGKRYFLFLFFEEKVRATGIRILCVGSKGNLLR